MIPAITIDGEGGCGKGTLSMRLARWLQWHLLDSGVLYRFLAWLIAERGVQEITEKMLTPLWSEFHGLSFQVPLDAELPQVWFQGQDISAAVRSETIGEKASQLGALPWVRTELLAVQRAFRKDPGLITDGRDMGTVIFPDAPLKLFLMATAQERAHRRFLQLQKRGLQPDLQQIEADLLRRDVRDKTRTIAPLLPAADAIILDTTGLSRDQVFAKTQELVRQWLPDSVLKIENT